MQTAFMKIANILWLSLIALIILSGVLVGTGRLVSPYLKDFKSDIEAEVSQMVGSQISIGGMNAVWQGFGPVLRLRDVRVSQPGQQTEPLKLERVDLNISLKQIIQSGKVLPWNIVLHGIQLHLIREDNGDFNVVGFSSGEQAETDTEIYSLMPLLELPRLELRDTSIRWTDKTNKTTSTEFSDINLLFRSDGDRRQFDLSFNLPGALTQTLKVAVDITATRETIAQLSGELYIKTRNFNVTGWLKSLMPEPFELLQGRTDSDIWIKVENGDLVSINGKTDWQDVNVRRQDQDKDLLMERIGTVFELVKNLDSWQLDLMDFHLQSQDLIWPTTRLSYRHTQQENTYFAVDHIETRLWQPLADIFLPDDITSVPALGLEGSIDNLYAIWNHDLTAWYAQGKLSGLHTLPKTPSDAGDKPALPGVENLDAEFQFSESQGQLTIDSSDTTYVHPGLFRDPLKLDILEGQLKWQKTADNLWQIKTDKLTAISPHISTETRLLIEIPEEGKTQLDIQTDFHDGDASHASLYYPAGIMGKKLVEWLDRSIISGTVTSGSFILKGPLEDFAYSKTHNGHFEVLFNVEDTVLDYFSEWPRLEETDAQVRFHNNSLTIDVANARLLDSEVTEAVAHIQTLDPISPIRIRGTVLGPASDNLRILSETPLRKDFSRIASALSLSGDSKVKLDFKIPLGRLGKYELDGQVHFQSNNLQLNDWDLELKNIAGQLSFDLEGFKAQGLSASMMN